MLIEQAPLFIRRIFKATWRIPRKKKTIYLTFDDGPNPTTTPLVMNILEKYKVKATFFCVGDNVRKYPNEFQSYLDHGHRVGNHTMHHLKGFNTDSYQYTEDIEEADQYIHSTLFRPPYGRIKLKQLQSLKAKYHIIMWDVITRDYNASLTPHKIFKIVKRYSRNGSIIVFHDSLKSAKNMLEALPMSIEYLQEKGYRFELIPWKLNRNK